MSSIGQHEGLSAEQSVLGAVLIDSEALDKIHFLEPRDFIAARHQKLFEVMRYLHSRDRPIDLITITDHYNKRGKLESVGSVGYLTELAQACPTSADVIYHANIIRSQALGRRGSEIGREITELQRSDYESDDEYFTAVETLIGDLRPEAFADMRSFSEMEQAYFTHLKRKAEKMLSGFDQFDRWASLWRGWLYVLAGRPSVGKTAKALQMAVGIARQRQEIDMLMVDKMDAGDVLFFSQEMSESELIDRMVSNISGVSYNRMIEKGGKDGFTEDESKRIKEAYDELKSLPIYIMDKSAVTIEEIKSVARRYKKKHGKIAAIFVDYLQIMHIPRIKGVQRHEAIGVVTSSAKQIARQLNCTFILLSQMTRESENAEEPKLSHLKESGSIEQDADVVEFLWHDADDVETGGKVIQSTFAKGRNVGTNKFRYLFQGWIQRFKELEKKEAKPVEHPKKQWKKNK